MNASTPEALAAFYSALAEVRDIVKSKTADTGKYKYDYATLEQALDSVKAACSAHGLMVSQEPTGEGDKFELRTTLIHKDGGTVEFEPLVLPLPRDAQALGSASTYARRYSLVAIFAIAVADDDGQEATRQARNQQQYGGNRTAQELAIREVLNLFHNDDRKALVEAFKAEFNAGLADLPEHRHGDALDWLTANNQRLLTEATQVPPASPQAGRPPGVEPTGESTPNSPVGEVSATEVAG